MAVDPVAFGQEKVDLDSQIAGTQVGMNCWKNCRNTSTAPKAERWGEMMIDEIGRYDLLNPAEIARHKVVALPYKFPLFSSWRVPPSANQAR